MSASRPVADYLEPPMFLSSKDGPFISWAGHLHWLTWYERLCLFLKLTTVEKIANEHWPWRHSMILVNKYNKLVD